MPRNLRRLISMRLTPEIRNLIRKSLREDLGSGDVTTRFLISPKLKGGGIILAKQSGILAGQVVVDEVFRQIDSKIICQWKRRDGSRCRKGDVVARLKGPVASIVKAERTALNFLSHLSGIATLTNQFVKEIRGTNAKILDTRKTMPLWRTLQKYAVRMGGGVNHRTGLWDQGLIKDNHWAFVKDARIIAKVIHRHPKYRWIVEITKSNLKHISSVLAAKPSVILFDNFKPGELVKAIKTIKICSKKFRAHPLIEVSGGIHLGNVRSFAKVGVHRISIGALTHSVPAFDFSLEITKVD